MTMLPWLLTKNGRVAPCQEIAEDTLFSGESDDPLEYLIFDREIKHDLNCLRELQNKNYCYATRRTSSLRTHLFIVNILQNRFQIDQFLILVYHCDSVRH